MDVTSNQKVPPQLLAQARYGLSEDDPLVGLMDLIEKDQEEFRRTLLSDLRILSSGVEKQILALRTINEEQKNTLSVFRSFLAYMKGESIRFKLLVLIFSLLLGAPIGVLIGLNLNTQKEIVKSTQVRK